MTYLIHYGGPARGKRWLVREWRDPSDKGESLVDVPGEFSHVYSRVPSELWAQEDQIPGPTAVVRVEGTLREMSDGCIEIV